MRQVTKNQNDQPDTLTRSQTLALLEQLSREANPGLIRDAYFQGPYKDSHGRTQSYVRDKLNVYYFNKCAYCETFCKAHIEHYRPKKGVVEDPNHPGYYWLCYEWSNLIPSCPDCNTFGGKGTQFPVSGNRVTVPQFRPDNSLDKTFSLASSAYLLAEKPLLLHPEVDDPALYLSIELDPAGEGVKLTGIDQQERRGETTIRICNLNRKDLKLERLAVLDTFIAAITNVFRLLADGLLPVEHFGKALSLCFKQVDDDSLNPQITHTFIRTTWMANTANFDTIVLPRLLAGQQAIVQQAFQQYIQANPR